MPSERPQYSTVCLGVTAAFLALAGLIDVVKGGAVGKLAILLGVFLGVVFVALLWFPQKPRPTQRWDR